MFKCKGATSALAIVHKATTDVAAFSSMVVVAALDCPDLKIPMMSYFAGSVLAKSSTEENSIV